MEPMTKDVSVDIQYDRKRRFGVPVLKVGKCNEKLSPLRISIEGMNETLIPSSPR
jgi:hypothetical protein